MDAHEIGPMLARHHRSRILPWRCICGLRYPCGARRCALDEQLRHRTLAVTDWYCAYFAANPAAAFRPRGSR
jgi:hypothetical protein